MNDSVYNLTPQNSSEFRQCFGCNYEGVTNQTICPRCRKAKFFTSSNIRIRGTVLVVVGLFLVVIMGAIGVFVGLLLLGSMNNPDSAHKINDSIALLLGIYSVFGLVIAFGLNSLVSGIWMLVAGRRNRFLVWVMWALLFVLLVAGGAMRALLN